MGYRTKTIGTTKGGLGSAECSAAAEKSLLTCPKMAKNARRNARETLGTTKTAVNGGIDQSWKISWAPCTLVAREHG